MGCSVKLSKNTYIQRTLFCLILCSLSSLRCSCIWVPHDSACFLVTFLFSSVLNLGGNWNLVRLESVLILFSGDGSDGPGDAIIFDSELLLPSPSLAGVTGLPGNHTVTYLFANPLKLERRNSGFLWTFLAAFPEAFPNGKTKGGTRFSSSTSPRVLGWRGWALAERNPWNSR